MNSIASYTAVEAAGSLTITAELEPADVPVAEEAIIREARRITEESVTVAERRRAITAGEARREFAAETAEGRARSIGRAETVWTLEEEEAWVDRLRSVTAEQIRIVARRYLDPDRLASSG